MQTHTTVLRAPAAYQLLYICAVGIEMTDNNVDPSSVNQQIWTLDLQSPSRLKKKKATEKYDASP